MYYAECATRASTQKNFFSLSKITTAGFSVTTIYSNLTISKDKNLTTGTSVERDIYRMHMRTVSSTSVCSTGANSENLWYRRLGHANVEIVRSVVTTGLI